MGSGAGDEGQAVIDVLTRAGAERDAFCAQLGDEPEMDSAIVSDVLRVTGRVGAAVRTRTTLVQLAGILRSLDAALAGRIELAELASGLELQAARSDRFAGFGEARVELRTLCELLDHLAAGAASVAAVTGQVAVLDASLRAWLLTELTGSETGAFAEAAPHAVQSGSVDPRAPHRVLDSSRARAHDALARELLQGAMHHPITGLPGAVWVRGWTAVPVIGEQLGDSGDEVRRVAAALGVLDGAGELVQVDLAVVPRWELSGGRIRATGAVRPSYELPATAEGVALAAGTRRSLALLTTPDGDFAFAEGDEHHVVAGPRPFIDAYLDGTTVADALATFRLQVEELAGDDDEPPQHLLEVAARYGRLRRRGFRAGT